MKFLTVSLSALKCNSFRKKQIIASNLKGFSVAIVFFHFKGKNCKLWWSAPQKMPNANFNFQYAEARSHLVPAFVTLAVSVGLKNINKLPVCLLIFSRLCLRIFSFFLSFFLSYLTHILRSRSRSDLSFVCFCSTLPCLLLFSFLLFYFTFNRRWFYFKLKHFEGEKGFLQTNSSSSFEWFVSINAFTRIPRRQHQPIFCLSTLICRLLLYFRGHW